MRGRITLKYTFQNRVEIELERDKNGELSLYFLTPADREEKILVLGKDGNGFGELGCWDAAAEIKDGNIYLYGNNGPGGGLKAVELIIPMTLADLKISEASSYFDDEEISKQPHPDDFSQSFHP